MAKSIITLILLFSILSFGICQELNYNIINETSYNQYISKQWKELIKTGKSAKKAGIEFYNLDYRVAIAFYQTANYRKATALFEKMYANDTQNKLLKEYLYYSYLFSGRISDAKLLSKSFNDRLINKLKLDTGVYNLQSFSLETKVNFFNYDSIIKNPSIIVESKERTQLQYYNVNLNHQIGYHLNINTAFTFLTGRNFHVDPTVSNTKFETKLKQFQFYLAPYIGLSKGWEIQTAYHYLNYTQKTTDQSLNHNTDTIQNSHAGLFRLTKKWKYFDFGISMEASNLNQKIQLTPGTEIFYYPLGNNNLYFLNKVRYQLQSNVDQFDRNFILQQKIGFKVFNHLWVEPFWLIGGLNNFTDENIYVLYNSNDIIENWYGIQAHIPMVKNKISLYFIYQRINYSTTYEFNLNTKNRHYSNNSILGGLLWNLNY